MRLIFKKSTKIQNPRLYDFKVKALNIILIFTSSELCDGKPDVVLTCDSDAMNCTEWQSFIE